MFVTRKDSVSRQVIHMIEMSDIKETITASEMPA